MFFLETMTDHFACVQCLCDNFKMLFGAPPAEAHAPTSKNSKPEFDELEEFNVKNLRASKQMPGDESLINFTCSAIAMELQTNLQRTWQQ